MNYQHVCFNKEAQELFSELKEKGLTSQDFPDFVKNAFHDKVDELRVKHGLVAI